MFDDESSNCPLRSNQESQNSKAAIEIAFKVDMLYLAILEMSFISHGILV
jgi:hypothetical protein